MKCPIDDTALSVSSRDGVEIDFCPQCRGVWLDRGELDKIIDRTANALAASPAAAAPPPPPRDERRYEEPRRYEDEHRYDDRRSDDRRRKKRSFMDDLFDFG